MTEIKGYMRIDQILEMDRGLGEVLLGHGLNCSGCPGALIETLEEAAEGHGVSLEKLLEDLNKYISDNTI